MNRFSKWLLKKAHEIWTRRIFKKYGHLESWQLWNEDRQRKAFLEAYVETGDTRCLIDYFQLRKPQDYRYFEKAFREALMMSVFRRYDEVRAILVDYWYQILVLEIRMRDKNCYLKNILEKSEYVILILHKTPKIDI